MKVQYTGTSDTQIFDASDMKKAGIEDSGFSKTSFHQGVGVEVPDEVGEALLSKEGLFGDYMFEEVNEDGDDSSERTTGEQSPDGSNEAGADGEEVAPATGTTTGTGGPTSTGRGTSTGGGARRTAKSTASSST